VAGSSKKAIYAALIGNSMIAVTKFAAAVHTGSSAMLSEGIHSLVDTGNQVLLLYGLRKAKTPASAEFPFGHGKEIYFWSFVVAMLIFALGGTVSIYKGWTHLTHPTTINNVLINYLVLGFAIVLRVLHYGWLLRSSISAADHGASSGPSSAEKIQHCSLLYSKIRPPCSVC
jgi:cation diffusion facilitator family transporter